MFVPKTTPVLLISTAIAPSTFLREQAEGTETSQLIAFTLEHWSLAASPGGSASTWSKAQGRKWEFFWRHRGIDTRSQGSHTLTWLCMSCLGLGAGRAQFGPSFSCTLGLFPFQSKLALAELFRDCLSFPDSHKAQDTSTDPGDLEYHPYFSEVPGSIRAKWAILLLLKEQLKKQDKPQKAQINCSQMVIKDWFSTFLCAIHLQSSHAHVPLDSTAA